MPGQEAIARDRWFRAGWILTLLVSLLILVAGLYVVAVPISEDTFEQVTGVVWDDFAAGNPEVADNMEMENRLLGILSLGFAVYALVITWTRLRLGDTWAARIMWVLPITLVALVVLFFLGGSTIVGGFYAIVTVTAVVGQLLVERALRAEPQDHAV